MIIKICGMKEALNIKEAEDCGVDIIGLIFYKKSLRYVSEIPKYLPIKAKIAGVFVDEKENIIINIVKKYKLNYIQLHGNETPYFCNQLKTKGYKIIKAFNINSYEDLKKTKEYEKSCDYFLFDTKCKTKGGSGKHFNWKLLEKYNSSTPFLISGGIKLEDYEDLQKIKHPQLVGYDLNSCFEISPALKDINKLTQFTEQIKNKNNESNK